MPYYGVQLFLKEKSITNLGISSSVWWKILYSNISQPQLDYNFFPLYEVLPLKVLQSKASGLTGADFAVLNFKIIQKVHQSKMTPKTAILFSKSSNQRHPYLRIEIKNSPSKFISCHYDIHTLVYYIQTYLYVGSGVYFILNLIEGYTYFVLSRLGLA